MDILNYNNQQIGYKLIGHGHKTLVCFHGFQNDKHLFNVLHPLTNPSYTILSLDLPFHGDTQWQLNSFSPDDLIQILKNILTPTQFQKFEIIGYSLGGRLAMKLVELIPQQIHAVYLAAPEGLQAYPLHAFINTFPPFIKKGIAQILKKRDGRKLAAFIYKIGLLPKAQYLLYKRSVVSNKAALLFYFINSDLFKINKKALRLNISEQKMNTYFYFGKADKNIPPTSPNQLVLKHRYIHKFYFDCGHFLWKHQPFLTALIQDIKKEKL